MTEAVHEKGASYVPALILRRVAASSERITEPISERFDTAVLFADISGFTALTEKLAGHGAVGMEELSQVISAYLGCLVDVIVDHGGDIVKFAGDALLALWLASADEPLAVATRRAAQCALAIQSALGDFSRSASTPLSIKVALGAGPAICMHVGGVFNRWELLIAGEPFLQSGRAGYHAGPGDVVVSREAFALLGASDGGEPLDDGTVRLSSLGDEIACVPLIVPQVSHAAAELVLPYIPAAIRARLGAGDSGWLAELRRITVLFVNLPDVTHTTPIDQAQTLMHGLQTVLYQFEGSVNKLSVDDKGVTFIGVMGLPPLAHENDPARGLDAALALHTRLKDLGLRTAIGVTTGRAYCGSVGNTRRCEYTIMGDVVNLAARLMQAAPGSILCDAPTHDAVHEGFAFETLAPIKVKGKAEPVQVYRPLGHSTTVTARRRASQSIVGRRAELATLAAQLEALAHGGAGGTIVIEGEPGIGKSRLVEELEHNAKTMKIRTLMGAADSIERATSYYAWRGVFSTLLDLDRVTGPDERRDQVRTLLAPDPHLFRLAPLLNTVLPLDLPENEVTGQMTGEVRADNTHDLLLGLLQKAVAAGPLLVIIEDAHWKDSASWAFTRVVARGVKPLLLVLATRPISAPIPLEYTQVLELGALRMTLDSLAPDEAVALACRRLGVEALPEPVASLISDKAGGNPFFTEELTYALRDAGHIVVDDDRCTLAPGVDLQTISLPDTVEGVVSERIDRLTSDQQLSLKVASAVGRVFPERILSDIHPVEAARTQIADHLRVLRTLDLTPLEARDPEWLYIFKHIITQQVAYNLMLFSQRRELHHRIAEWYEREYAADLSPFYPALAHHYTMAEESAKAIDYLEKAGERAVRNFANEEAIAFFDQALALDEKAPVPSAPSRCAVWEEQLGEAYYALGKLGQSLEHLNRALTLLSRPPPGALWRHAVSLLGGTLRQTVHRVFPRWFVRAPGPQSPLLLVAARANERLCQIYYIQNAKVQSMNGAVTALNLAEAAGPSPELARSYSNVSVTAALVPAYALSDMYERLALGVGKAVGHTPSLAYAYEVVGLYHLGAGHWQRAEERLGQSIALAEQIGDRRRWDEAAFIAAVTIHRQGRFAEAKQRFDEIYAAGRRRGIVQVQLWGLTGRLALSLATGDDAEAYGLLDALLTEHGDRTDAVARADAILAFGIIAQAHLRAGDLRKARQAAEHVVYFIAESETISVYLVAGYQGLGEVLAALLEPARGDRAATERQMLRPTVKTFWSFARMYPVGRPMAFLWRGVYAWHDGHERKARRLFAKSLDWGERLGMRYDLAIAHREIARLDTADAAARRAHLEKARALFAELGAVKDLERL